jgi:hypothetical protein
MRLVGPNIQRRPSVNVLMTFAAEVSAFFTIASFFCSALVSPGVKLTVLLKHLGGLPDERPAEVTNNTINVSITDEQPIAAAMSLLARARETAIDCPAEQSPDNSSIPGPLPRKSAKLSATPMRERRSPCAPGFWQRQLAVERPGSGRP